jgi:hypothetical protein
MTKEKQSATYIYEGFCEEQGKRIKEEREITVGMGCTFGVGSDAYPAFVTRISDSGKTVWVKRGDFVADKENGHDYFGNQVWICTPNDSREEEAVRKTKYGWKMTGGSRVYFGKARAYQDPHF